MLVDKIRAKKIIILDLEERLFIPFLQPIKKELDNMHVPISYFISTRYIGDVAFELLKIPKNRHFPIEISKKLHLTDIYLSAHIHGSGYKKSIKVNVSHNQPVKWLLPPKNCFVNYDCHFLTGQLNREQVEQAIREYGLENNGIKLYDIGYPKLDEMLSGKWNHNVIMDELGLDNTKKTVIYAPSWDEGLSLRTFGMAIIDALVKIPDINLIIKLHPISLVDDDHPYFEMYTGGINWKEALRKYEHHENVLFPITSYINPLLYISDLLITDVSSVALEYVFLERPMLFYESRFYFENILPTLYNEFGNKALDPKDQMKNLRINGGRNFGLIFRDLDEMTALIKENLDRPYTYSTEDKKIIQGLLYNPGCAAKIAASQLLKLLEMR